MKKRIFAMILMLLVSMLYCGYNGPGTSSSASGSSVIEQTKPDISAEKDVFIPLDIADISFYGVWKIEKVAGYGRVSAGEEAGRRSLGEKVSFGPEDAIICNKQIKPVFYYRIIISKDDFFRYSWVDAERLGLSGQVVEVIVLSTSDRLHKTAWRSQYSFVIKDDKSVLICCENVWFELVRETREFE